ncbi:MAG TPA: hypothetical protein VIY86_14740, partial [Pirellulaceae bacterium]
MTNFAGTTVGATVEPGENNNFNLAAYNELGTVWWKWTCTSDGSAEMVVCSPTASLVSAAFTGDEFDPSGPVTVSLLNTISQPLSDTFLCPEPRVYGGGGASFVAIAGFTYWFAVMTYPGQGHPAGEFQGTFTFTPPPPNVFTNDFFTDRIALIGTNLTMLGNNGDATVEAGENVTTGNGTLAATVWYSWTPPATGMGYITSANSDLTIRSFRGTEVGALTPIALAPDGGTPVMSNDTIVIQVGTLGPAGPGLFTLNLRLEAPGILAPNDAFANRIEITAPEYQFRGSIYGATNEPGEPLPAPDSRQTLWWRFRAPDAG